MLTIENVTAVTLRAIARFKKEQRKIEAQLRFRNRFLYATQQDFAATCGVETAIALRLGREVLHSLADSTFCF